MQIVQIRWSRCCCCCCCIDFCLEGAHASTSRSGITHLLCCHDGAATDILTPPPGCPMQAPLNPAAVRLLAVVFWQPNPAAARLSTLRNSRCVAPPWSFCASVPVSSIVHHNAPSRQAARCQRVPCGGAVMQFGCPGFAGQSDVSHLQMTGLPTLPLECAAWQTLSLLPAG
jgi:hypothetical protein